MTDAEQLRLKLQELQAELREIDEIDGETRRLLEGAMEEIHEALRHDNTEALQHPSLVDNLNRATQDFETSHPGLTRIVGNMVDILGNAGI
ncbi:MULTISPECIES: DUF4404 family protein [Blastopirellula]|uniref:DUF4404 domain-containing protein n=1 Tax=Blastopirellula marina DSM 3645 TaxID=314230 RepID=A3ZNJ3_9BACT|nr:MULTISPECIES: DUF4404 family protein [Blastopirellula]EAQ81888.1 hypothetical protein DSM3645_17090 [Blastopirellula marina DSM 3645]UUO07533.1 DUF4404 family protein [Blastopirellula sp. J2-11]